MDASRITYAPNDPTDFLDSANPGTVAEALDVLATADNAANVLTAIKTVDGAGSGLDADKLDGVSASGFQVTAVSDKFRAPTGFQAASLVATTLYSANVCYFMHLGVAHQAYTTINVRTECTTAWSNASGGNGWAELGIWSGALTFGSGTSLTRRGTTDVTGTHNSTGLKLTTITVSGIAIGDEFWLVAGTSPGTGIGGNVMNLRAGLFDQIQTGWLQSLAGRPSTVASPSTAAVLTDATKVPAWVGVALFDVAPG